MTKIFTVELVSPMLGGLAHYRSPGEYASLCNRASTWVPAEPGSKICKVCRAKLEKLGITP